MDRIIHDSSSGAFPVVGERRDRGAPEFVKGRITWNADGRTDCTEDRRAVLVGIVPDGERHKAFARSSVVLDRKFIGRLGKYDRDAHRELVRMLDWAETRVFDVRVSDDDPFVHATFGSFSFEGVRRDRGTEEDAYGSISWTAHPEKSPVEMRSIRALMSLDGEDKVHGDGYFDGNFEAESGFVGSLAECGGEARDALIGRMGWNSGNFAVHPC